MASDECEQNTTLSQNLIIMTHDASMNAWGLKRTDIQTAMFSYIPSIDLPKQDEERELIE